MNSRGLRRVADSMFGRGRTNEYLTPTEQNWALQRELQELQRRYNDLHAYAAELETEVDNLKERNGNAIEAYETLRNTGSHLREDSKEKDDEILKLQQEILQYKSIVSGSTVSNKQLSDTTLQDNMGSLFFALRDWAVGVVRQGNIAFDSVGPDETFLPSCVPQYHEGNFTQKVHALIATFSKVLMLFYKQDYVFGMGSDESYQSATRFYKSFRGMPEGAQQKKKQWVLLTNDILSENPAVVERCDEETLDIFIENYQRELSGFSRSKVEPGIFRRLKSVLKSHMATIYSLDHQEAGYFFQMTSAVRRNGSPKTFKADHMEDINDGQAGVLESVLFPMVYKQDLQNEKDYIVVCKAKVAIAS